MYEGKIFECFGCIEDKRQEAKVKHKLIDIIFLVIASVICGCNEWKEIYMWATEEVNIAWLKKYIALENGIPSLSTIGRLFNIINPKQLEKCFAHWMKTAVELAQKDVVSIDGKTMKGSRDIIEGKKGVHIVSALCDSHNLILGQVKTDEKSNEITAIPELLDMLFLEGCIVTIDAMGAQKKIVEKIINDNHADYVINLKGNQETLHNEVIEYFEDLEKEGVIDNLKLSEQEAKDDTEKSKDKKIDMCSTMDKGHGRIEKRIYIFSTDIDWMVDAKKDWAGLNGIGLVMREVTFSTGEKTFEKAHYIGSADNVGDFAKAARNHWGVESMHWTLDVTFRDDANKTRKGQLPRNMAVLKRIALNTVKNDTSRYPKESMKGKRFRALMNFSYRDFLIDLNFKERQ